jgi:hypothetical protein
MRLSLQMNRRSSTPTGYKSLRGKAKAGRGRRYGAYRSDGPKGPEAEPGGRHGYHAYSFIIARSAWNRTSFTTLYEGGWRGAMPCDVRGAALCSDNTPTGSDKRSGASGRLPRCAHQICVTGFCGKAAPTDPRACGKPTYRELLGKCALQTTLYEWLGIRPEPPHTSCIKRSTFRANYTARLLFKRRSKVQSGYFDFG